MSELNTKHKTCNVRAKGKIWNPEPRMTELGGTSEHRTYNVRVRGKTWNPEPKMTELGRTSEHRAKVRAWNLGHQN